MRRLAVGGARYDFLEQPLYAPSEVLRELQGKGVQQLRVGGWFALRPEIFDCFDDTGSEKLLPEAVRYDPNRERISGVEEPLREAKAVSRSILRKGRQRIGHVGIDLFAVYEPDCPGRIYAWCAPRPPGVP